MPVLHFFMLILSLLLAATIATRADVPRLEPAELRALLQKGEAVAVDVRGTVPWQHGHIAGAVWMPLGLVNQRAGELPQDKLIVTYCTCKSEETSLDGAMILAQQHGLTRVAVLRGGYPAWVAAGYPTELERTVRFSAGEPAAPAPPAHSGSGRLAPPKEVPCDRNDLTSYAGTVTSYRRERDQTILVLATSADTVERVTIRHRGTGDPSPYFLLLGEPFTKRDWPRIERRKGELVKKMSAVAWVCEGGAVLVDWRPGQTFTGAE